MDGTVVEYFGEQGESHCGYCGSTDKSSYGMWAHRMTVADYQALIDRGWRRSGKYCYKPILESTCCPQYTIRCDPENFVLRRSQKKVLKRMLRFLRTGSIKATEDSPSDQLSDSGKDECQPCDVDRNSKNECKSMLIREKLMKTRSVHVEMAPAASFTSQRSADLVDSAKSYDNPFKTTDPVVPSALNKRKRKQLRKQRAIEKLAAKGLPPTPDNRGAKPLEDWLKELSSEEKPVHRLQLKLIKPDRKGPHFAESFNVYKKYQVTIHHDKPEELSEHSFERFLIASPLTYEEENSPEHPGYGLFHQLYLLDDKLIGVGVIDIMPAGVSSKYFFYDPDYSFLSLGIYSALREIAFVRSLAKLTPSLCYYYMGFYIHSCVKMRYKAQYCPSYLLCPETFTWHPVAQCLPLLDKSKYARFAEASQVDNGIEGLDVRNVLVLYNRRVILYATYLELKRVSSEERRIVSEYSRLVGKNCATRMILYRE